MERHDTFKVMFSKKKQDAGCWLMYFQGNIGMREMQLIFHGFTCVLLIRIYEGRGVTDNWALSLVSFISWSLTDDVKPDRLNRHIPPHSQGLTDLPLVSKHFSLQSLWCVKSSRLHCVTWTGPSHQRHQQSPCLVNRETEPQSKPSAFVFTPISCAISDCVDYGLIAMQSGPSLPGIVFLLWYTLSLFSEREQKGEPERERQTGTSSV